MFLPDSRFEMPELFEPGRKPVGNVKIDWEGSYLAGMDDDELEAFRAGVVLMPSGKYYNKRGVYDPDVFTAKRERNTSVFTAGNSESIQHDGTGINRFRISALGIPNTIIICFTPRSNGQNGFGRLFEEDNAGRGALYLRSSAPRMRMGTGGLDADLNSFIPVFGQKYIAYCKKGAGDWTVGVAKIGGVIEDTATGDAILGASLPLYIGNRSALDRSFEGDIDYVINDYREWPEAEILKIIKSPYYFLIPA